ncbi:hypothetical protein [Nonomuraea dietziae]|uniref:Uncharacterized protein n=1 Tax=Nonomuraea dietziae TaxID=65515 RepID=A0A7W5YAB6_9ACTN|nr:hypothetical protein [Nonomuraea dietziae]MBB3730266.1 hypothetical protein [Nonomuraea dietziae]
MQWKWLALVALSALCAVMPLVPSMGVRPASMIRDTPVMHEAQSPKLLVENTFHVTQGIGVDERLLPVDDNVHFARAVLAPGVSVDEAGIMYGTPKRPGTYSTTITVCKDKICADERITLVVHRKVIWSPVQLTFPARLGVLLDSSIGIEGAPEGVLATYTVTDAGKLPPGVAIGPDGHVGGVPTRAGRYDAPVRICVAGDCSGVVVRFIVA